MTSSNSYTFSLEFAEIIAEAWERCQFNPQVVDGETARSARRSLNLAFVSWANRGLHLWTIERGTFTCVTGTSSYTLPVGTIDITDVNRYASGTEYPMAPLGRSDYAALPVKTTRGAANQYWCERIQPLPVLHLYPTPDNSTDTIIYYRIRALQDASAAAQTPDAPQQWLDAICAELAARMATKLVKEKVLRDDLRTAADIAYAVATSNDRERVSMVVRPSWAAGMGS